MVSFKNIWYESIQKILLTLFSYRNRGRNETGKREGGGGRFVVVLVSHASDRQGQAGQPSFDISTQSREIRLSRRDNKPRVFSSLFFLSARSCAVTGVTHSSVSIWKEMCRAVLSLVPATCSPNVFPSRRLRPRRLFERRQWEGWTERRPNSRQRCAIFCYVTKQSR